MRGMVCALFKLTIHIRESAEDQITEAKNLLDILLFVISIGSASFVGRDELEKKKERRGGRCGTARMNSYETCFSIS